MKYCETCKNICDAERCSFCGNMQIKEVKLDDYCFLLECDETFGEMLRFTLNDKNIACALVPFGSGVRSALGLNLGNYRVYVPYQHLEESMEIVDTLSNDPTSELRESLLTNERLWHVKSNRTLKKMRKKLKLTENEEVFDNIKSAVLNATKITDAGLISSCPQRGHYLTIKIKDITIWFNSATYEIYI